MKKNIFLFCFITLLSATSCLDDNDSSFSGSNQFAVVQKNITGTKYIIVPQGMIQNDILNNYDQGDSFIISSYKANIGNSNSSGIINAEYINIEKSFPNKIQKTVNFAIADTAINIKQQIGLKQLSIESNVNSVVYLDRSLITYNADLADDEQYNLNFYYDATKQVDQTGTALPANRIVIDIVIDPSGEGIGEKKITTEQLVLNSSDLRSKLTPSDYPDGFVVISVDFRYSLYNTTAQKYNEVYSLDKMRFIYYKPV